MVTVVGNKYQNILTQETMKTLFTRSVISISIALAVVCDCAGQGFLGTGIDRYAEFHVISTIRRPGGLTEVLERVKPVDGMLADFRLQVINTRTSRNQDVDGFENVGYYRRRLMIDCKTQEYCVLDATYYDLYGNEIKSDHTYGMAKWFKIPEATMRELELYKARSLATR